MRRPLGWAAAALAVVAIPAAAAYWLAYDTLGGPQPWLDSAMGFGQGSPMESVVLADETVLLSDLTPFEWETVSLFREGTSGEFLRAETGLTFLDGTWFDASRHLMVFCMDGHVVDVHAHHRVSVSFRQRTLSNAAVIDDGEFLEPSGEPVSAVCVPDWTAPGP